MAKKQRSQRLATKKKPARKKSTAKRRSTRKKSTTKKATKKSAQRHGGKKWVRGVKTVSTFPPQDVFTKDAETIAKVMASKKVSPKGIGSGIRMIQYFINRAGKDLPADRKAELERAKHLLQEKNAKSKAGK
jgi:tRNA(adenine34) deaminase